MKLALIVLARCLAADSEIHDLQDGYDLELEAAASVGQALEDCGDRHAVGGHNERVANGAIDLADVQRQIDARKARKTAEVLCVSRMIKRLPATQRSIMHNYYINRLPLGAVAKKLGYSYGYARNLRIDAMATIGAIGDDDVMEMLPPDYDATPTVSEIAAYGE